MVEIVKYSRACACVRVHYIYRDKLNKKNCEAKKQRNLFFLVFMMTNRAMVRHYTEILYSLYNLK